MLLTLRCVHAKDKAMALGLIQFAIGLFGKRLFIAAGSPVNTNVSRTANVPCPIIYGAVVDSACFVWEKTCGEHGACWLYDASTFRVSFHGIAHILSPSLTIVEVDLFISGTTGALMLCAFLVDLVVWYKADKITFPEDEEPPKVEIDREAQPMAVQYESTL